MKNCLRESGWLCNLDDAEFQICSTKLWVLAGDKNIPQADAVHVQNVMDSGGTETNEEWVGSTYSVEEVKAQLQVHLMPTKTSNKRAIQIGCIDLLKRVM